MTFVWGDVDPVSGAHMIVRVEERIERADVRRFADVPYGIAVQPDGKLVVDGYSSNGKDLDFTVVRYEPEERLALPPGPGGERRVAEYHEASQREPKQG